MSNGAHTWLTPSASADEFEAERQNLLDKVDVCAAQKSEQYKLEWESKRRAEEVKELQKVSHADHCRRGTQRTCLMHVLCAPQDKNLLKYHVSCACM